MTFMEKAHKEIQMIDLFMIIMTVVWSIVLVLNIGGVIDANLWGIHFVFGAYWFLWAAGLHTRWNRTGLELEQMAKEVNCCYLFDRNDASSPLYSHDQHY
ncbi:hypothetical protein [Pelobacter propionicus]|nr:hypothetical protein [Pelobacter propionicus]